MSSDLHRQPSIIITSYLAVSHIWISPDDQDVSLWGVYGNLANSEITTIRVETDFQTLHDLLPHSDGEYAEEVILAISKGMTEPSEENGIIDLCDLGGLHFEEHIFSLQFILEEDESGNLTEPEEPCYQLQGYIPRNNLLPYFMDFDIPSEINERVRYHHQLLAMQYQLYTLLLPKMNKTYALTFSNLNDPLYFEMAKTQFELQQAMKS